MITTLLTRHGRGTLTAVGLALALLVTSCSEPASPPAETPPPAASEVTPEPAPPAETSASPPPVAAAPAGPIPVKVSLFSWPGYGFWFITK